MSEPARPCHIVAEPHHRTALCGRTNPVPVVLQRYARAHDYEQLRCAACFIAADMADLLEGPWRIIPPPALTDAEHRCVRLAGELWNGLCQIVGNDESRAGDLAELVHHVHAIQNAVLAQAAARAYPGRYRLLGGAL